uniref:Uncharacterized protein n=1 Tax=viral metagenome TaxID=1070528 RepID=A0A6M3IHZ3_9ZZZZ
MAIQSFQLDPNAQSYTDDEIVGKVNAASASITRSGCLAGATLSACDADDLSESASKKWAAESGAQVNPTGAEIITAINGAATAITREGALDQDSLKLVKTNPTTGEFYVKNIQRDATGKLDVEYDDTAA